MASAPARKRDDLQPSGAPAREDPPKQEAPAAGLALRLARAAREGGDVLVVAAGEARAEELRRALEVVGPGLQAVVVPAWDCLPYDRASPSRESMGRRMRALAELAAPRTGPRVVVAAPEALIQRLPPVEALAGGEFAVRPGDELDRDALHAFADRFGYVLADRIDEPGELAVLGEVVDVFPPHLDRPVRVRLDEGGRVTEIDSYDPLTQRSAARLDELVLGPATELVGEGLPRAAGDEHRLPLAYDGMSTLFGLLPGARLHVEPAAAERAASLLEQVAEARAAQLDFAEPGAATPLSADALHLSSDELAAGLDGPPLGLDLAGLAPAPAFATAANPGGAFCAAVAEAVGAGRAVVLTGRRHELRLLDRALERGLKRTAKAAQTWEAATVPGEVSALEADLAAGFVDEAAGVTVLATADVVGGRVARRSDSGAALLAEPELRLGDVVIDEAHGVGVLRALETVEAAGVVQDALRLEYHGGAVLLVPVEDIGRIWRYGAEESAVALDRLKGDGWAKRRAEVSRQIEADARALVEQAREREAVRADPVEAPAAAVAKFAARFAFPETPDQKAAIAAVLADLASGRPMNRLVCGDVGFGKTEVALRAAAAVALSGRQAAVAAPTTVLARQHAAVFARRFAGTGIKVAQLSRLVDAAEAKEVKAGLASGEIGVVIGTHGLASEGVVFKDLALMVLDEEQKFGAQLKAQLLAKAPHHLAMTATPIPRTLQAAMVGVQEVSVIATPPARRRPIRTFLSPFEAASFRTALLREKRRGGQSFVVAPRISDLDVLAARLAELAPELTVRTAHGELPAEEVDRVMVDFADGRGDVLLATDIIESGLDVPRANTMMVWRADRFGLAQLHQLRGRVGRGRVQGVAYLLTDPDEEVSDATRARLSTLEAFDRLGSGMAVAARDLDLRGGGDLVGEAQAGHMKLIGAQLHQQLMVRAVRAARGEADGPEWTPELRLGDTAASLPPDYIPDAVIRINLHARLARLTTLAEVDAFEEELEDRFGEPPAAVDALLARSRLALLAKAAGVAKVSVGPAAVAMDLAPGADAAAAEAKTSGRGDVAWRHGRLVLAAREGWEPVSAAAELLQQLG